MRANRGKSKFVSMGSKKSRTACLEDANANPIQMEKQCLENSISKKCLGDQISKMEMLSMRLRIVEKRLRVLWKTMNEDDSNLCKNVSAQFIMASL